MVNEAFVDGLRDIIYHKGVCLNWMRKDDENIHFMMVVLEERDVDVIKTSNIINDVCKDYDLKIVRCLVSSSIKTHIVFVIGEMTE